MDIALDLGTGRTRIQTAANKKIFSEPSVIAYYTESEQIAAVGVKAQRMLGKTPPSITAVCPLEGGVIANSDLVEEMINVFLNRVCTNKIIMPRVVACIPGEITSVEKRAMVNAISSFGVRRVYLIESAKAAAMGAGMNINLPHGNMVVDLGAGTVDIAVISLGGISVSKSIKKAGDAMDYEIIRYVRKKHSIIIGKQTACSCKTAIGSAAPVQSSAEFTVKGRDAISGLPASAVITAQEAYEALYDVSQEIAAGVLQVLEKTPPELIGDIHTDGITLTGGLSALAGFPELIREKTGISNISVARNADECVVRGCAMATLSIADVESGGPYEINPLLAAY